MIKYIFFFGAFAIASWGFAQTKISQEQDSKDVQATIEQLFKGMYQADTSMIRATFHPTARMQTVYAHKGTQKPALHTENTIDGFLKSIAMPHSEPYNEEIQSYDIKIDEHLATAWTPYKFYIGKTLLHSGVNAFHLIRNEAGKWQITQVTDTRRK